MIWRVFLIWLLGAPAAWAAGNNAQVLLNGPGSPSNSATNYSSLNGGTAWNATETNVQTLAGPAGTFYGLRVTLSAAPGASKQYVFTVRKNAANTAVTCTISGSSTTSCSDMSNTFTVAAGDRLAIASVPTSTPTAATAQISVLFSGTTAPQTEVGGGTGATNLSTSATNYFSPHSPATPSATEANVEMVIPTSGTFDGLRVQLSGTPNNGGGTQTYTFTVRKSAGNTTMTCAISEATSTCNDTAHPFTVVAGDRIAISSAPSGTPTARLAWVGLIFTPNVEGEFVLALSNATALNSSTTQYAPLQSGSIAWNSTESGNADQRSYKMAVKNIYVNLSAAPGTSGSGKSYAFTLRRSAQDTDPALTCTVLDTATTCNASTNVLVTTDNLLDTKVVPTGTPGTPVASVSYLGFSTPRRLVRFD